MYKKITHTIVEEHFDHPIASKIKRIIENQKVTVPNDLIYDEAEFRTAVSNYMTSYANTVNSLIDSQTAPNDALISIFESAFSTVDNLGNLTKPFMTSELGEKINAAMRYILVYLTMAVQMSKIGADINQIKGRMTGIGNDLASAMAFHNANWSAGTTSETNVYQLFPAMINDIFEKLTAKVSNNTEMIQQATTKIQNDFSNFNTLFADGLVNRYIQRFSTTQNIPA